MCANIKAINHVVSVPLPGHPEVGGQRQAGLRESKHPVLTIQAPLTATVTPLSPLVLRSLCCTPKSTPGVQAPASHPSAGVQARTPLLRARQIARNLNQTEEATKGATATLKQASLAPALYHL